MFVAKENSPSQLVERLFLTKINNGHENKKKNCIFETKFKSQNKLVFLMRCIRFLCRKKILANTKNRLKIFKYLQAC